MRKNTKEITTVAEVLYVIKIHLILHSSDFLGFHNVNSENNVVKEMIRRVVINNHLNPCFIKYKHLPAACILCVLNSTYNTRTLP